ncbi:MAG: DNA adenine methylase [Candidatus Udaeobacter sp.]
MQPLLRWAGSKRQLVPTLSEFFDPNLHERYVEPFAGSACLFFSLKPKKAILGDINGDLIRTYRDIKYRCKDVTDRLRRFRKSKREFLRRRKPNSRSSTRAYRAARFIYLNRCCFNGIYRTNLKGEFNVPYGGKGSGPIPTDLQEHARALHPAVLISGDFEKVLARTKPGDFVYLDPPFSVDSRRVFREYDASQFDFGSIWRLRICLEELAASNVNFLVSYAVCNEAWFLAEGFQTKIVRVRRNVAGFAKHRRYARELLIWN